MVDGYHLHFPWLMPTMSTQTHPLMRVLFLILLAPILGTAHTAVQAQQWCPPGAQWSHEYQSVNW
jgi:hypothetical protein